MKFFLGVFFCLVVLSCHSLTAQYHFDSWTTDNGLPQNGVRSISQTPDGYLWFTTLDGLVRFDGVQFTIFNKSKSKGIINNRFWAMRSFSDGSIWAATEGGDLTIYRDGKFTSYPAEQVPEQLILGFEKDENGEVLINADSSFYYLRNGEFVFAKKSENDGTQKKINFGQSGTRWEVYPTETRQIKNGQTKIYQLQIKYLNYYYQSVYEDKKGGLWITDKGKLYYLQNGEITEYNEKDGIPQNIQGHNFWEESDGSLWFATGEYSAAGVGLIRFKDGKFSRFGVEQGLSNDRIFSVFKDREGTVWLATDKGLNRLRSQIMTTLSAKDGLVNNEAYPILKSRDGSIYIGTVGGLSRYQDGKFTNTILRDNGGGGVLAIQSLWEDEEGRLWIGVVGGLFVLKAGKVEDWSKKFEKRDTVYSIYSLKDGTVLIGTEHFGVWQYKDGKITVAFTTAEGLPSNDIKFIHEDRNGDLWFGTYGGLSILKDGKFTNYTTNEGLPSNYLRSMKEDTDGTLWIGSYDGGLSRFRDGKFFNFNTENGLFSNGVFAIMEDKNSNFWMSSNQGIYRVAKQQLNDFADGKINHYESFGYGKNDGMLNTECNGGRQPSALMDSSGKIWFPTLEGIAIVNPDALQTNQVPPPVQIEKVEIDRENIWTENASNDSNFAVKINPSDIHLDITYTALSLIKSDQIHFRYKLEGLDEDWLDGGTKRTVNYTHLPSGSYTFKVIASNSDGVWNTEGKSFKIVVYAPFYKTWWFWTLMVLLFLSGAYLIYRYRINQLQKLNLAQENFARQLIESQESERKRIAQELHDSLGQNLLVIKNRALLGLAVEDKDEQFSEIQDSVSDALVEVRSIAYNLRPLHIERLGLTSTLEEMIEDVEKSSNISINYDIAPINGLFSPENEINFYRIVQESLNNIVKHSKADKASVEVFRDGNKITLTVKDNGKGFETDKVNEKKGLGLNGIAERAKILGGNYSIDSELEKGTTVLVEIEAK
ncbi:MAG: hypothetical protein K1X72_01675 [Pyrinomonadaceae bacterium]|nr:hypothetical protein [Pyrinomonadaceae bacterium]